MAKGGMSEKKTFGGKVYRYRGKYRSKTEAKSRAARSRKYAGGARVIKSGKYYYVYGLK